MSSVELQDCSLTYIKFGNGLNTMVCFHGYGQSKEHFLVFEKQFGSEYTLYAFDLFFHGASYWQKGEEPMQKDFLANLFKLFLVKEGIKRFSIMGFSIGGKFASVLAEYFSDHIDQLILMASDGFKDNAFYRLATTRKSGRGLFKRIMKSSFLFGFFLKVMSKIINIQPSLVKLYESETSNAELRTKVYLTWVVFRNLKIQLTPFCERINNSGMKVIIVTGLYDAIIKAEVFDSTIKCLHKVEHLVLNCGHGGILKYASEDSTFKKILIP